MANPKQAWWYGANMVSVMNNPNAGDVYWMDGTNGLDTNAGTSPVEPVLTLTYALSLCTAGNNDYIIVMGNPGDAGEAAWPIPIDVSKVHIIGTPSQAAPSPLFDAPADTACFDIEASNVEIAGLEFASGASFACIETSGLIWKGHIHHNFFNWQNGGQDAIQLSNNTDNADCPHWWIHDNKFGAFSTQHGIHIAYNSTRTIIERNFFLDVASGGIGVYVDQAGAAVGAILDNTFTVADAATGEAITFIAGTAGCTIAGNRTGEGTVAMGNVPYRDLGANNWGLNYYDIQAIMPVTV
jgi:hypothetical protein